MVPDKDKCRWIVTGGSGYIGSRIIGAYPANSLFVSHHSPTPKDFARVQVDLLNQKDLLSVLREIRPSGIIHLAGLSGPSTNERQPQLAQLLNIGVTQTLADYCHEVGASIMFMSTDKVFDGTVDFPNEHSPLSPITLYGELKAQAEQIITERTSNYLIFRLPIVHSNDYWANNSLIDAKLLSLYRKHKVQIYKDVYRSFLLTDQLESTITTALSNNTFGIFHLGTQVSSYHERLLAILPPNLKDQISMIEGIAGVARPMRQTLDCRLAEETFSINFV